MRIACISPVQHSGTTVIATLLGHALAYTQNQNVMLMYTGSTRRLCAYQGVSAMGDKTRSITQIVKLLESKAIDPADIASYAVSMDSNKKIKVMDTVSEAVSEEDIVKLSSYIYANVPEDIVICDVTSQIYDDTTQEIFNNSDIVIFVIEPSVSHFNAIKTWIKSDYSPPPHVRLMYVINRYDEQILALRNISSLIGVKHNAMCKLHYNPNIVKHCFDGNLQSIIPYVMEKDVRVVELNNDLKEMCQFVMSVMGARFKWEV